MSEQIADQAYSTLQRLKNELDKDNLLHIMSYEANQQLRKLGGFIKQLGSTKQCECK